jgi:HEAT repeat protein
MAAAYFIVTRFRRQEVLVQSQASTAETPFPIDAAFAELSEAERCDFIFACQALDDRESLALIERALDDPCESVAIAAARAMARRGQTEDLHCYFARRSDERSLRIARAVELLA